MKVVYSQYSSTNSQGCIELRSGERACNSWIAKYLLLKLEVNLPIVDIEKKGPWLMTKQPSRLGILWQAKAENIIKRGIFMGKINYCMGKFILHWQIYFYKGKSIIALANLCLHGQFYYCVSKSIIALANLCLHGQFYYAWQICFVWA